MDEHRQGMSKGGTMRIEFSSYGPSGHGELERHSLEVKEGTTVKALLDDLSTLLATNSDRDAAVSGARFVVVNGIYVTPRDWGRQLRNGDAVTVLPFVAGG